MKVTNILSRLVCSIAIFAFSAAASDVQFVVNSDVKASEVTMDDLKRVFLGTKTSLDDGSKVEPVLANGGAAHDAFLKQIGKSDTALRTYYKSLVFTGKGSMPKSFGTDAEVAAYVAKTKGAIGYVGSAAAAPGTKKLTVK
jgi:ABC-type phosphate transport system substrate-binding protein